MAQNKINDEKEATEQVPAPYRRKVPRNLILLLFFFFCIIGSLIGIGIAVFSHSEDPSTIKAPAYVSRPLHEEQPLPEANVTQPVISETPTATVPEIKSDVGPESVPLPTPTEQPAAQKEQNIQLIPQTIPKAETPKTAPHSFNTIQAPVFAHLNKTPQIVLVIDDMGLNRRNSKRLADLRFPLTLAYMPYAEDLQLQTQNASMHGHELIVHMPMQPQHMEKNNPGPNALLSNLSAEENVKRLDANLSKFEGYIGLNNHMGSALTSNRTALAPIMAEVKKRGLWFLDSRTIGNSVAGDLAAEMGVPYVTRDIFLDNVENVAAIQNQLHQVEVIAQHRGYAVAIGHPYDVTVTALETWLPQALQKGFEIVPLSTVITERFPAAPIPRYARTKMRTSISANEIEPAAGGAQAF